MRVNIGEIKVRKKINIGEIKMGIKKVSPELEDLEVTPSTEEQNFTGIYENVKVNKITSDLIPNLTPDIIADGEEVLDLVGTHKGGELPLELTNIDGVIQIKLDAKNLCSPNVSDYDISSGTYGFRKIIDDLDGKNLVMSISDKDTTVNMSGVYFGFTANGKNANEGHIWIFSSGGADSDYISTNTHKYFSFYPKNTETFNKIFKRYNIQIELTESTEPTEYAPYTSINLIYDNTVSIKLSNSDKVVVETAEPQKDYTKDGLIRLYDGINNSNNGHSNSISQWYNHANNSYDLNIKDLSVYPWTENSLDLVTSYEGYLKSSGQFTLGECTLEIVCRCEPYQKNGSPISFGYDVSRRFGIYKYTNNSLTVANESTETTVSNINLSNKQTISLVRSSTGMKLYINGVLKCSQSGSASSFTGSLLINDFISTSYTRTYIDVNAIRVYNRPLTQSELLNNNTVDKSIYKF